MSATDQPYSEAAAAAAWDELDARSPEHIPFGDEVARAILGAAHDREALGLEASVHAASHRREVIAELVAWLESKGWQLGARAVREFAESEATHGQ